ncbi:hypothetical protein ASD31_13880 [Rhizobium sp. Root482]|nr:hypothetical protein ASD31_13880 [Rhizobium sp. Root482]
MAYPILRIVAAVVISDQFVEMAPFRRNAAVTALTPIPAFVVREPKSPSAAIDEGNSAFLARSCNMNPRIEIKTQLYGT